MFGIGFRLPWYPLASAAALHQATVTGRAPDPAADPAFVRRAEIADIKYRVDRWLGYTLLVGGVAALLYGTAVGTPGHGSPYWRSLSGALLALGIAGASLAVGAIGGFLFGLPRSLTSSEFREIVALRARAEETSDDAPAADKAMSAQPAAAAAGSYGPNTNLERISDWLTTIIVGVGLTQLGHLIPQLDQFGDRVTSLFTTGGHSFGIAAALYFSIFGFLMSYISTRTKLTLVFTENLQDARILEDSRYTRLAVRESIAVERAATSSPVKPPVLQDSMTPPTGRAGPPISPDDEVVLNRQLSERQTPEQTLAIANASARTGDYAKALVLYRDYIKTATFDTKIWIDYAGVLGLTGDEATFDSLLNSFASKADAQQAESTFRQGLKSALNANLYTKRPDESIRLGEMLVARGGGDDAWTRVWLACAYGQRHALLAGDPRRHAEAEAAAERATVEVQRALALDPASKALIVSLYDPARVNGADDDLTSLYPLQKLHTVLGI